MKVLVVGGGGREHALCAALARSERVERLFCAPGNGGIQAVAECRPDLLASDLEGLAAFAEKEGIDLTVVGPEAPLVAGIVDVFQARGLRVFGPGQAGARLEGSKSFAKELMQRHNVPTAAYHKFTTLAEARDHVQATDYFPIVVKADGLAAGKGVMICQDQEEALKALTDCMSDKRFGEAGETVVIEEFLRGEEASVHAVTDGKTLYILPTSQDHKAIGEGDTGPNTGGMGAYSPAPIVEGSMHAKVEETILRPTLNGLRREGIDYRGVLYAGLMITKGGPRVLEFNVRFGDPETEVILPRLASDLAELLLATAEGRLDQLEPPAFDSRSCVGVVIASGGYPGSYQPGKRIQGLEQAEAMPGVAVYHAGTRRRDDGFVTAGGRVLCVTALGDGFQAARDAAYEATDAIQFEGAYRRGDIAHRALRRSLQGQQ